VSQASRIRQLIYAALILVGFVGTQYYLIQFVEQTSGEFTIANLIAFDWARFMADGYANPAASFISVDVAIGLAGFIVFCVAECSRIKMKMGLVCIPVALFVAYAVAWPLFLLMRERHLEAPE
jgi:hypothetical protein